jgi:AcrR family transcriptional regulator
MWAPVTSPVAWHIVQTLPRPYHHGDLRAALLARAEQTLRDKGSGGISLRELAREVGVSHAAPSRHFADRQALLDALALAGFERLDESIAASLAAVGPSFAEQLTAMVRAYVGFATANAALLELMYSVKHDPQASADLIAAVERWAARCVELISDGQRRREVRAGPPEIVGLTVFTTMHGFADLAASGVLPAPLAEPALQEVIAYILRGCAPDKPGRRGRQ